jgi:hypothetical protein
MLRHLALLVLLTLCACFRGIDAVDTKQRDPAQPLALELEVADQNAGLWQPNQAPRSPVLTLRSPRPLSSDAERHVFLLRGTPSEETLDDLASGSLRESTTQQRVTLTFPAGANDGALTAQPTSPLTPGADYSLIWAEPDAAQTFALHVSESPAAGARLVQTLPAELDSRVPPNLSHALLRFDGYVLGDVAAAITLRGADGGALPSRLRQLPCAELGLAPGDCVELLPDAPLPALERFVLSLQSGLHDATGAPIAAQEIGFRTAPADDALAPRWVDLECAKDEVKQGAACILINDVELSLRARANESGTLTLGCADQRRASLSGSGDFELSLGLAAPASCLLSLADLAGNRASTALGVAPLRGLSALAIMEVRADPLGPEPSQEYVELLNFGDTPLSIEGFTLSTDMFATGQRIVGAAVLAPSERLLVVAPEFDSAEASDGSLPAGVRLARLDRALALRNEGAALLLRDAKGQRLSASPALAGARAGQCIERVGSNFRSGAVSAFRATPGGGCTPGSASDDP